jgi:hypothetical protein
MIGKYLIGASLYMHGVVRQDQEPDWFDSSWT